MVERHQYNHQPAQHIDAGKTRNFDHRSLPIVVFALSCRYRRRSMISVLTEITEGVEFDPWN
jgi:hypothetical protein